MHMNRVLIRWFVSLFDVRTLDFLLKIEFDKTMNSMSNVNTTKKNIKKIIYGYTTRSLSILSIENIT
jgi:hypothetical protein